MTPSTVIFMPQILKSSITYLLWNQQRCAFQDQSNADSDLLEARKYIFWNENFFRRSTPGSEFRLIWVCSRESSLPERAS
jgi:hypothetical protein